MVLHSPSELAPGLFERVAFCESSDRSQRGQDCSLYVFALGLDRALYERLSFMFHLKPCCQLGVLA